jgi:hypothetical protein
MGWIPRRDWPLNKDGPTAGLLPQVPAPVADASFDDWLAQIPVAGLRGYGLAALWVIAGAMTGEIVEIHLAPALANGDVVILDNLPEHRSERAERSTRFGAASSTSMVWSSPKNIRTTSLPQDMIRLNARCSVL